MKKIKLKKRSLSIIIGIVAIAMVGGILAYYNATSSLENRLSTNKYGGEQMIEKFNPDGDWELGEKVTKEVSVENTGTAALFVRVKLDEKWVRDNIELIALDSKDGEGKFSNTNFIAGTGQVNATDGTTTGDGSVVIKELGSGKWVYSDKDGYWYYNEVLKPVGEVGAKTQDFLKSITLASDTDMGVLQETKYYTKNSSLPDNDSISSDETQGWKEFSGAVPQGAKYSRSISGLKPGFTGYADADYSLIITYETYQATPEAREEVISTEGANWDSNRVPELN